MNTCVGNTAPCYNCDNREIGCHSKCKQYIEFTELQSEIRKQRYKDNDISAHLKRQRNDAIRKTIHGRKK